MGVPYLGQGGWGEFQADMISVLALLLNRSFYRLATDIARCVQEIRNASTEWAELVQAIINALRVSVRASGRCRSS